MQRTRLISWFAVVATLAIVAPVLVPVLREARRHARDRTCLSNLHQIGTAMQMYLQDNDESFPPAYEAVYEDSGTHFAAWDSLLDPYIKSGISPEAGWAFVDGWNASTVPATVNHVPSSDVGGPWRCPEDIDGGVLSYGLNPMVSGVVKYFHHVSIDGKWTRAQEWQDSLKLSQIRDPGAIVWAGDTNRLWDEKAKTYGPVFPEWPRRTDLYLRDLSPAELVDWYRTFLARDVTLYGDDCAYPLPWGCRGPAYRHGRSGGVPVATMLFCDGHVHPFPLGTLKVENIFPDLDGRAPAPMTHPEPRYSIARIETANVNSGMHAGGLNNNGEVAGSNYWDMVWWKDGQAHDIPGTDGKGSGTSWGVNDSGVIVSDDRLYVNGKFQKLGSMPRYDGIAARAINNRGQVVGRMYSTTNPAVPGHAFLWQDGTFTDLGAPPGCVSSTAYAINDRGDVVGDAVTAKNQTHAVLWSNNVARDLGTLPGGSLSIAYGINDAGQIVGDSDTAAGKAFLFHAFLWQNGKMRDLGLPQGDRYCIGRAINNHGQVVIATTDLDHVPMSPLIWDEQHGMRRLDALCPFDNGWLLRDTYGINDHGQILCWGFYHTTMSLALLTPTDNAAPFTTAQAGAP